MSDEGEIFKNKLVSGFAETHRIKKNFAVAYSPWVNGTVENAMCQVRSACTSLLSEFKLGPQDWPLVGGTVTIALNESPLRRLGKGRGGRYRTPLQVRTGIEPRRL